MPLHTEIMDVIAYRLPDLPCWVEARATLLWGPCEILGHQRSLNFPLSFVILIMG